MPNQTTTPRERPTAGKRSPFPHRRPRRTRLVALALAVTLLTLATLIGLTFRADGDWRAETASSVQLCLQQQSPTGAAPHQMPDRGHLARCLAGRQSVRRDPVEVLAAALSVLVAAEIGYLTRHR